MFAFNISPWRSHINVNVKFYNIDKLYVVDGIFSFYKSIPSQVPCYRATRVSYQGLMQVPEVGSNRTRHSISSHIHLKLFAASVQHTKELGSEWT